MRDTSLEQIALEQFTVHAQSFATSAVINDETALAVLVGLAALGGGERVADIACGPGIVSVALARAGAGEVVGVDLTPEMLRLARERADAAGVGAAVQLQLGRMDDSGLAPASFDRVVSRYALHHAADPAAAVAELARLCAPGGRVVVVDFDAPADGAVAGRYDGAERLRDPSHVANLTRDRQVALLEGAGLVVVGEERYRIEADLDTVLARSHGVDHDGVRAAFVASIGGDGLGVDAHWADGRVRFAYPIVALAAEPAG